MADFCKHCGSPLSTHDTSCPVCGASVSPAAQPHQSSASRHTSRAGAPRQVDIPQNPSKPHKTSKFVYILPIIILSLAAILVVLLKDNNKSHRTHSYSDYDTEQVETNTDQATAQQSLAANAQQESTGPDEDEIERRKRSLLSGFREILRKNPNENYIITDLNGNGFPELWITYNVGNYADGRVHIYHSSKGNPVEIATVEANALATIGNRVLAEQGNDYWVSYTYNGNRIIEEGYWGSGEDLSDELISTTYTGPLEAAFDF